MKKLLILLCLMALLAPAALAENSYTARCGGTSVLSVRYDGGAFSLDTDSYLSSSRGNHTWLGMFYNGSYTIELAADRYDDLPADCGVEQLSAYLCGLTQGTALETYSAGLPFVILSLNGPSGQSYYAAAMSQGYVVHFEIYNFRGGADAGALGVLKQLLNGVSR